MDELVLYVTAGDPADKQNQESLGVVALLHKANTVTTFRNAECPLNGAAITGFGPGERMLVAGNNRAQILAYAWGKESADQRLPVPENITCLAVAHHPDSGLQAHKAAYRVPWLLAAGCPTGKLYLWEFALGDLVCVKSAHYQAITVMEFSPCGLFLVTAGADTRVNVWRTQDLVSAENTAARPYATFTDHSLAVTGVRFRQGPLDAQVLTASRDGTLRIYDVYSRAAVTTFVFSAAVECFACDPAGRALYAGLADGLVRRVDLYKVNPVTHVLEAVGGTKKIVTVEEDPELAATFVQHQTTTGCHATCMQVTMDGMRLVLGDTAGRVFVADTVTKQVVKAFTPLKLAIASLHVAAASPQQLGHDMLFDKKSRLLPTFKRVLAPPELINHTLTMQIPVKAAAEDTFEDWLKEKAAEEDAFRFQKPDTANTTKTDADLQAKLDTVGEAYTKLKSMYEDLLAQQELAE